VWYVQGGRGSGKTRSGSEAFAEIIRRSIEAGDGDEDGDWGICSPTFGDARDVCVEGPSGLRHALAGYTDGPWHKAWNRSQGQLKLANGATVFADGADDGAPRVQGKNLRGQWADEVGLWRKWEKAWDESIAFAVRLDPAVIVATGTPKAGHGLVKRLIGGDPDLGLPPADLVTKMRMADNIDNLSRHQVDRLMARYGGTSLGRQELDGELLDEVEGALWNLRLIDETRRAEAGPMARIVVGVDPQGSAESGTTGIVAAGITCGDCPCGGKNLPHAFVLDDASLSSSPAGWARAAIASFERTKADRIVAERNFGADMVESTIRTVWSTAPIEIVNASRGKVQRAEPIAALYEQGRVHHVGSFGDLESEMVTWTQTENWSPNRLDALVWAITELGLSEWREARISSPVGRTL
jgi:phage terminase large subunit-like protein